METGKHSLTGGPARPAKRRIVAAVVPLIALAALALGINQSASAAGPGSPNIIFILTDDQTLQEMSALPQTNALLAGQGASFNRSYVSYPLCCPSRVSFLSGRYMHNHGVRGNGAPFGGASRFETLGTEATELPARLKTAGYHTAHIGKVLNGFGGGAACGEGSNPHVPAGWDEFYGKLAITNGGCSENNYFQYSLLEQGTGDPNGIHLPPGDIVDYGSSDADYQTDVYRNIALGVLDDELPGPNPLYLSVAFGAPHGPFEPAPRHKFTLQSQRLPKLPGFNEANVKDKPSFIRDRARHRLSVIEKSNIANRRHRRLEMLLSVDEAVAAIVTKVNLEGELANTYFIFSSDNGFFFGEHRIGNGKYLPYEPSSRVPLIIRGPGIPAGVSSDELVSNVDYMPTVLQIAGASADPNAPVDGRSVLPFAANPGARTRRPVLLEGDIGPGLGPGQTSPEALKQRRGRSRAARLGLTNKRGVTDLDQERGAERFAINGNIDVPAFRGIRSDRYTYFIYATGEQELYDMAKDPAQMRNLIYNRRYKRVQRKLYNRMLRLAFCYADSCNAATGPDPKPKKKPKRKKGKRRR